MKMYKAIFLTALLVPALALPSLAATKMDNAGDAPQSTAQSGMMTKEQKAKFTTMQRDFEQKVAPMREQLQAKFMELHAIQNLSGTTHAEVTKLIEEITALRGKLRVERQAFIASLEKEGLPTHGMHGMMGGMGGMGGMDCMMGGMKGGMMGGMGGAHGGMKGGMMGGMQDGMDGGMNGGHGDMKGGKGAKQHGNAM